MLITLDMTGDVPIYQQLRNQIVLGIGSGQLVAGEGLPTVRQLAEDLGVNAMTVNKAYALLREQGFIEIDRRHGAKVCASALPIDKRWRDDLALLLAEGLARGLKDAELAEIVGEICADFQEGRK